jgi:diaminopimelate decarboxylase
MYRNAFRGTAVAYPADALRLDAVAAWIRREGVTVDVTDVDRLDWAVLAGIGPSHIVMHGVDDASGSIAVDYGVGRFIVDRVEQVAVLESRFGGGTRSVLVDATDGCIDELVSAVTADRRLELVGLHCRADGVDLVELAQIIFEMIGEMARVGREHAVLLPRLSLGDLPRLSLGDIDVIDYGVEPRGMRRVAELIDEVVEEGCIRFRYPRPGLTLSPSRTTLLPAA